MFSLEREGQVDCIGKMMRVVDMTVLGVFEVWWFKLRFVLRSERK